MYWNNWDRNGVVGIMDPYSLDVPESETRLKKWFYLFHTVQTVLGAQWALFIKKNSVWRSCNHTSLMYSFKYNQQDAPLYNILYYCQCPICFGGFSAHHQELKNFTHSIWYVPGLFAATASGSSKQAWHIPDAVCKVLELLMMGGETPETYRALTIINNIV